MPIKPVITRSRADVAADNLKHYILDANLQPGERLPSERELATHLGISRPILREALRHLATLGVVESRTGSGTYLTSTISPDDQHVIMQIENERTALLQYLELRRALESEVVAILATRASADDIKELELLVDALEKEHFETGSAAETDKAFHLALYRLSGNPLFMQILKPIWSMLERLWHQPLGKQHVGSQTVHLHREIVLCIKQRDPAGASNLVREMLRLVEQDLRD